MFALGIELLPVIDEASLVRHPVAIDHLARFQLDAVVVAVRVVVFNRATPKLAIAHDFADVLENELACERDATRSYTRSGNQIGQIVLLRTLMRLTNWFHCKRGRDTPPQAAGTHLFDQKRDTDELTRHLQFEPP